MISIISTRVIIYCSVWDQAWCCSTSSQNTSCSRLLNFKGGSQFLQHIWPCSLLTVSRNMSSDSSMCRPTNAASSPVSATADPTDAWAHLYGTLAGGIEERFPKHKGGLRWKEIQRIYIVPGNFTVYLWDQHGNKRCSRHHLNSRRQQGVVKKKKNK